MEMFSEITSDGTDVMLLIQHFVDLLITNRILSIIIIFTGTAAVFFTYHVLYFLKFILKMRKLGKEADKLPGTKKHWFWGNLKDIPAPDDPKIMKFWHDRVIEFPRAHRIWFGPLLVFVSLGHPDTIKKLLKSSEPKYTDKSGGYTLFLPWIGDGLLLSSGAKWFRNRRLLTPAFHFDILKAYISIYNESTDTLIGKFLKESNTNKAIDITQAVCLCTLDTILKCAFSQDLDVQEQGSSHPYVKAVLELSGLLMERALNPLVRFSDFLYSLTSKGRRAMKHCRCAHAMAEKLIRERRKMLEEEEKDITEKKRYLDFLDILLTAQDDNGVGLTDLEIRNEVDTFLFEGHDTTASGISWSLYCFAKHADVQERAWKEIDDLLGARQDIKLEDLGKLPYLTLCIKEVLRLYPPVPVISRQLSQPVEVEGATLKPGTITDISIYGLHHNPLVWGEDHMVFKPERFLHENVKDMDSYAYIPFSAGSRNCIGQNFAMNELKVIIAKVLHRFRLEADPGHDPGAIPQLVLRAKNGFKIKFKQRI